MRLFFRALLCLVTLHNSLGAITYPKSSHIVFEKQNGKIEKVHQIKLQEYNSSYCEDDYYEFLCQDTSDNADVYITYGALMRQTVITTNGDLTAEVEVYTVLDFDVGGGNQFRFQIVPDPASSAHPVDLDVTWTNTNDCPDNEGFPCQQAWKASISTQNPLICNIDGDYSVDFNLECYPSVQNCPQASQGLVESFTFALDSQNYCPQEVEHVSVAGTLTAYEDATLQTVQQAYKSGDTVYLKHTFHSDVVTPIANLIIGIYVEHRGVVFDLYVEQAFTQLGLDLMLNVDNNAGAFSFDLDPASFPIEYRKMEDVDVSAIIQIEYAELPPVNLLEAKESSKDVRKNRRTPGFIDNVSIPTFTTISVSKSGEVHVEEDVQRNPQPATASTYVISLLAVCGSLVAAFLV